MDQSCATAQSTIRRGQMLGGVCTSTPRAICGAWLGGPGCVFARCPARTARCVACRWPRHCTRMEGSDSQPCDCSVAQGSVRGGTPARCARNGKETRTGMAALGQGSACQEARTIAAGDRCASLASSGLYTCPRCVDHLFGGVPHRQPADYPERSLLGPPPIHRVPSDMEAC